MPNKKSSRVADMDNELLAEIELNKLQQQHRAVEDEHKLYVDRTQRILWHQQKVIKSLHKEKKDLLRNSIAVFSHQNLKIDRLSTEELKRLLLKKEDYDILINSEKAVKDQLDNKIQELEKLVNEQRKLTGALSSIYCHHRQLQKQISTLESRLYQATIRFDNFLAKNAKLREDVETLEIQKTLFEKLSKKLKSMLSQQRKNMEEVITQSVQAYEQRAEAQARILVLKERNLKDLVQFDAEIKELKRIIDHETKLITFMQIKLAELPTGEEEDTPTLEGADSKAKDRDDEETLENYQGILTEMAKLTGHKDADDFINKLIEKEQEIFAGFSYINELNSEVKDLYHEVERLENEILKLQSIRKYAEEEVCRNIKEVEEKLQKTTKDADLAESHYNDERKNLDHLKLKTELLFKNIKSDSTNITNKLGCSNGAMDSNILDYLAEIEKKVKKLLFVKTCLNIKKAEDQSELSVLPDDPLLGGSVLQHTVTSVEIAHPASKENIYAEASSIPLDYSALREKVRQNLQSIQQQRQSMDKVIHSHSSDKRHGKDRKRS